MPHDPTKERMSRPRRGMRVRTLLMAPIQVCLLGLLMECVPGPLFWYKMEDSWGDRGSHAYIVRGGGSYAFVSYPDMRSQGLTSLGRVGYVRRVRSAQHWLFTTWRIETRRFTYSLTPNGRTLSAAERAQLRRAFAEWLRTHMPPYQTLAKKVQFHIDGLALPDGEDRHWLWWGTLGNGAVALVVLWPVWLLLGDVRRTMRSVKRSRALQRGRCPGCAYDIRGQTLARCPECGGQWLPHERP